MIPSRAVPPRFLWIVLLALLAVSLPVPAQVPVGARIRLPAGATAEWAVPATIELAVSGSGFSGFGWNGGFAGVGSNGKKERGSPYFSIQAGRGPTFYACDTVLGFPQRLGNAPLINRRGGSSFIAIKTTPKGGRRIWICASVGAFRISGGATAEWEYQVRYDSGDPDTGGTPTVQIGTVPNADVFVGEPLSGVEVEVDFLGVPNLTGAIGDGLFFPSGIIPGATGTISMMVTNRGSGVAEGNLDVHFYLSSDTTLSKLEDAPLGSARAPQLSLAPGGELRIFSEPVKLPPTLPGIPYFLIAEMVSALTPPETNLTDNVVVEFMPLPKLDVTLQAIRVPDARPGRTGAVEVVVRNVGRGSFMGGPVEMDLLMGSHRDRVTLTIPPLPPDGSVTRSVDPWVVPRDLFTTPLTSAGADYQVVASLDPDGKLQGVIPSNARDSEFLLVHGYTIRGRVVTVKHHRPVPDVQASVYRIIEGSELGSSGPVVGRALTQEDGTYEIQGLPLDSYLVKVEEENWVFSALDDWVNHRLVLIDGCGWRQLLSQGEWVAADYFGFGEVILRSVKTEYSGTPYFVAGVGFDVDFLFDVDWGSAEPGEVILSQDGDELSFPAKREAFSVEVDVGRRFRPCLDVVAKAVGDAGEESKEVRVPMVMLPKPLWPPVGFTPVNSANPLYYKLSTGFDWDLIKAYNLTDRDLSTIPGIDELGIKWTPSLKVELKEDTIKGQLADLGEPFLKFKLGGLTDLKFTPFLELANRFRPAGCEWGFESFSVGAKGSSTFVNLIYPLPSPWPVFARLSIKGELNVKGSLNGEDSGRPLFSLTAEPKAIGRGSIEGGIPYIVSVGGFGELEAAATFDVPPGKFTKAGVALQFGLTVTVIGVRNDFSSLRFEWPKKAGAIPLLAGWPESWGTEFVPMDRDYLDRIQYPEWDETAASARRSLQGSDQVDSLGRRLQTLISEGHPESHADLEAAGNEVTLGWVVDDPGRPALHRTMAVSSWRQPGGTWAAPTPIWDDGTADFHPRLRGLPDGTLFAAWEDLDASVRTDADITELLGAMEISAARWDPVQQRWVDPIRLSRNQHLDRSPRVVARSETDAVVAWVSNPGNELLGSPGSPNALVVARYGPAGWEAPSEVARLPHPLIYLDAADGPNGVVIVLEADLDRDLSTTADHELFIVEEEAGGWSLPRRLTDDVVADQSPQLLRGQDGGLTLVWLRGRDLSTAPLLDLSRRTVAYQSPAPESLFAFRLTSNASGQMAVSWVEPSETLTDLAAVFFDPASGTWSEPLRLTKDPEVERGHDALLLADGSWLAAYNRVTPPEPGAFLARAAGGQLLAGPQPVPGSEADLVVLDIPARPDLALVPGSLRAVPGNPSAGETVSVQFGYTNRAAWPVAGASAVLYRGTPGAGGVEVARVPLDRLVGGASREGAVPWTVPVGAPDLGLTLRLELATGIMDADPSNNLASLSLSRADLSVDPMYWVLLDDGRLRITAEVVNLGPVASLPATLVFEGPLDPAGGSARRPVPALQPGAREVFSVESPGVSPGERRVVSATLTEITHPEFDNSNHTASVSVGTPATGLIRVTGIRNPAGGMEVRFRSTPGEVYLLEASEDLQRWSEVARTTAAGTDGSLVDGTSPVGKFRFYRLRRGAP